MTITGTVARYARLRSGAHVATVTRVSPAPDAAPTFIVETREQDGPVFTPCPTWRHALEYAATRISASLAQSCAANVRAW